VPVGEVSTEAQNLVELFNLYGHFAIVILFSERQVLTVTDDVAAHYPLLLRWNVNIPPL
jgi:hypothetical protein